MKSIMVVVLVVVLAPFYVWAADAASTEKKVDISKMTCKELMSGDDSDRAAGIAFFHGFASGKKGVQSVDLKAMSALSDKVKDYCLSNPSSTVMDAFNKSAK